jgi:hypothetical protein
MCDVVARTDFWISRSRFKLLKYFEFQNSRLPRGETFLLFLFLEKSKKEQKLPINWKRNWLFGHGSGNCIGSSCATLSSFAPVILHCFLSSFFRLPTNSKKTKQEEATYADDHIYFSVSCWLFGLFADSVPER